MTRMIFVRHGESTGNKEQRFYGHYDGGLTDRGRAQAAATAEFLKDVHIDIAYGSDLKRAYETGEIIAKPHGLKVIPDKNLREIFAGDWENLHIDEIKERYSKAYITWKTDIWNAHPVNGERVSEVTKRIDDEVWKIAKENDGKTVLIATHATPIRTLSCKWLGRPYDDMKNIDWVRNASVSIVEYDTEKNQTKLELLGEDSYMGDLSTALTKKV